MTEGELKGFFAKQYIKAAINHYISYKRDIYYVTIGEDRLPAILFIHGSTGPMTIYNDYFTDVELLKHFSLYAVDRPGYGVTGGNPEISIQRQAQLILPLAKSIYRVHQPLIVVADTYGATIACRLVMEERGIVQGLVLINPWLRPPGEKADALTSFMSRTFLKRFLSRETLAALEEKKFLQRELNKMKVSWNKLQVPVTYLLTKKKSNFSSRNLDSDSTDFLNDPATHVHYLGGGTRNILSHYRTEIRDKILELQQML
jgi:uncharacterized protein